MANNKNIRLFINYPLEQGVISELTSKQAHYLKNVMRQKLSDLLYVFNGNDGEFEAEIKSLDKNSSYIEIKELTREMRGEPDISLIFAPIKHGKIDFLVQKATELGVSELIPVFTERTVIKRINEERMASNAIEAAEQCERLTIPKIHSISKLEKVLGHWNKERKILVCDETGNGKSIKEVLSENSDIKAVIIGPEGGFTRAELDMMYKLPYVIPAGMGPRIMRADTAAIAALTCWQEHLGDWNIPPSFKG